MYNKKENSRSYVWCARETEHKAAHYVALVFEIISTYRIAL